MAAPFPNHPFLLSAADVAAALECDVDRGLTSAQVTGLAARYPPNVLDVKSGIAWYRILFRQVCNAMVMVRWTCHPPPSSLSWPFSRLSLIALG